MYDIPTIKTNLAGVVGWRQPLEAEFAILDAANLVSSSGLIFQGVHRLVTVENLKNALPELSDAEFNTTILDMQKDAIQKVVQNVFQLKKPRTKALLDKLRLFDNANVKDDFIENVAGRWVGYEIDLAKNNNLKVVIDALGSEFDGVQAGVTISLFHSSQKDAIVTFDLDTIENDSKFDDLTDFVMDYLTFVGGTYYIGYEQDDLVAVRALNRTFSQSEQANTPKHFTVQPIRVENYVGPDLFDIDDIESASETHGLNFEFTTTVDITNLISDQKQTFADLISKQMAADVLTTMIYSIRINAIKEETRRMALLELKGTDKNRKIGLEWQLEKAIEETEFDFSALDPLIVPTRDKFQIAAL